MDDNHEVGRKVKQPTRQFDVVLKMVEGAIGRYRMGLDVTYDLTLSWGPNPHGQLSLAYWLALATPNPILGGDPIAHLVSLDFQPNEKVIDDAVVAAFAQLREQRAKALSLSNGKGHHS